MKSIIINSTHNITYKSRLIRKIRKCLTEILRLRCVFRKLAVNFVTSKSLFSLSEKANESTFN